MNLRRTIVTVTSTLALTGLSIAIPTAAQAASCTVSKTSYISVSATCSGVSQYRAWTECYKGGSHPQYTITTGPWKTSGNSVATCPAGFTVNGNNFGVDVA